MGDTRLSLPELASRLLHDGVAVARAEAGLFKARVVARLGAARSGAVLLVVAVVLALLALIALVVGVMMALATVVGFLLAALIVFVVLIVVAAIFGWLGARQLSTKPQAIVETVS